MKCERVCVLWGKAALDRECGKTGVRNAGYLRSSRLTPGATSFFFDYNPLKKFLNLPTS
jgi:hypothetical protein